MIYVTRLKGEEIVINAGLIESVEATPDTVVTMATGKKLLVLESIEEVVQRIIDYQRQIGHPTFVQPPLLKTKEDGGMVDEG